MDASVVALVLLAALLHAGWNALLRGGEDRFWSMGVMNIAPGCIGLGVCLWGGLPSAASLPLVVASGLLHILYNALLVLTYRSGDLGQTYPIARGTSPALVSVGAALLAGEVLPLAAAVGVALVSGGIVALALSRGGVGRAGLVAALATGATIAAYTLVDGLGVRVSGDWLAYTAAMFCFHLALPAWLVARRGVRALAGKPRQFGLAILGGTVSVAAYAVVIWAMRTGAMGAVSALRETSVVFAVLLGRIVLGEGLTARRLAASLVIALGAVLIGQA